MRGKLKRQIVDFLNTRPPPSSAAFLLAELLACEGMLRAYLTDDDGSSEPEGTGAPSLPSAGVRAGER